MHAIDIPELPDGWHRGRAVTQEERYKDPGPNTDSNFVRIIGLADCDIEHCFYDLPSTTDWGDIVQFFRVGSHNADEPDFNVQLVKAKVRAIQSRIPGRVFFADGAGFNVRFDSVVTQEDYEFLKRLYPEEDMMPGGLEEHLNYWEGEDHPLESLLTDPVLALWWD